MIKPCGYQLNATSAVIDHIIKNPDRNPVVASATGTGKSIMIGHIIHSLHQKRPNIKVMVGCHVAKLLKQNAGKLRDFVPSADIGFFSDQLGEKSIENQFVFAGIQSVWRLPQEQIPFFNLLIIDEAHAVGREESSMWQTLIAKLRVVNPRIIVIGYSATPWREDSGSLTHGEGALFDDIVFNYSLAHGIQDGYLCKLTAKYTELKYDISNVGKLAGEFNLKQLEAATNIDALNLQAAKEWAEKSHDRLAWLGFCNGVAHSFAMRDALRSLGISAETVTGDTPEHERDRILTDFESGKIRAVTNNGVWTTGVDAPFIDCIGMFRHTMSSSLLLQMAGRGTRVMTNVWQYETPKERREAIANSSKKDTLFLDFAGNIERHGFLDQIKPKEKKEKGEGVPPMKGCPECASILPAPARKCPDCGYEFPQNTATKITTAYNGPVLSEPMVRDVVDIIYTPHNLNKEGKTPCLRVQYLHPDNQVTNEYVCLQHDGFAFTKALKWWNERSGGLTLGGQENRIENIFKFKLPERLLIPRQITVAKDGKYDRITHYSDFVTNADFFATKESHLANDSFEDDTMWF